jgi:hypothetical protein
MSCGKYIRIKEDQHLMLEISNIKRKYMEQEIEKKIWEFIDGHCSEAEKAFILRELSENPVWKNKYTELMNLHEMLLREDLEMPSLRFTKNVMEEITKYQVAPATKNYINKNVILGISSFFLVLIGGLTIYIIGQIHWNNNPTGTIFPSKSLDFNKLNWSKLFNNSFVNIFIGTSAILILILADKYLQTRKNRPYTNH